MRNHYHHDGHGGHEGHRPGGEHFHGDHDRDFDHHGGPIKMTPVPNTNRHGAGAVGAAPPLSDLMQVLLGVGPDGGPTSAKSASAPSPAGSVGGHGRGGRATTYQAPLPRVFSPPPGETRFRVDQIVVEMPSTFSETAIQSLLKRHRLVESERFMSSELAFSRRVWRFLDKRDVREVLWELGRERALTNVQPNFVYAPQDEATVEAGGQYSLRKMHVDPSLEVKSGDAVRVAVIDTAIDQAHPDLEGAIEATFDAIGGGAARSLDHGTSMAGAITARGRVKGVALRARILSARAFDVDGEGGALGSTFSVLKSLDWAAAHRARVINMSFAGPYDPALHEALAKIASKGIILIGAAGNAGPSSPPLYPAADPNVIAVTATDANDKVYSGANVGKYIAVSAPGVDVILPAPSGGYALETGTSVSSALVAGVVALMLEHRPGMKPAEARALLTSTASPLIGGGPRIFGAGLVDAERAIKALGP